MISLGRNTNQIYTTLAQGNVSSSTNWISSLSGIGISSLAFYGYASSLSMSGNGQSQIVTTPGTIYATVNSGQTWTGINGLLIGLLPTGLLGQGYLLSGAMSGSGQYIAINTTSSLCISNNSGATFTPQNITSFYSTIILSTPYISLPFENSIIDQQGNTTISILGNNQTASYVTGSSGAGSYAYAFNANTPISGFANQYLKSSATALSTLTNFAISGSFYMTSYGLSGRFQYIFSAGNGSVLLYTTYSRTLYATVNGNIIGGYLNLALSTWYNFTIIYQTNNVCYMFVNGVNVGSYANTGTFTLGAFTLGCQDPGLNYGFGGYLDNFNIYNLPPIPSNIASYYAVSGNGQYMLATILNTGVYISTSYGSWTQVVGILSTAIWTGAVISYTGQYMLVNTSSNGQYYSTNYGSTWVNSTAISNLSSVALSGTGQYAIGIKASTFTIYIITNYLAQFTSGSGYTIASCNPILSATNVPINAAISYTGQYMVIITTNTLNSNVYYSINYGASFIGVAIGSIPMVSCAISYDGSYITVANATTVYTLNNNSNGYSVAIGNQAGQTNQGQYAIAIGNQAGQDNQSANSIILNASGTAIPSYFPGYYASPIASYTSGLSSSFSLLGYGSDYQIVQGCCTLSNTNNLYLGLNVNGKLPTTSNEIIIGSNITGNGTNTITLGNTSSTAGIYTYGIITPSYTTLIAPTLSQIGYSISGTIAATSGTAGSNFAPLIVSVGVWLVSYLITFTNTTTFPNTVISMIPLTTQSYPIAVGQAATTGVATGTYTYNSSGSVTLGLSVVTPNSPITVASSYFTATRIA